VTPKKLRLAAVSFLNARPITYGLERGLGADRFDLRFDLPSRAAEALAAGDVDLALLPVASYAAAEDLRVIPGVAIASRGPVRTVLLVGEVPWQEMREIALDDGSRSSAMMLRLLARERGLAPTFTEVAHDEVASAASGTRGALVIGDAGLTVAEHYPHVYDLGREWTQLTGLPFVYAVWAGRPGVAQPEDVSLLRASLRAGLEHRADIARAWAAERGIDAGVCANYLQHNIHYVLGAEELSGAAAFIHRAHAAGLLPRPTVVRLFDDGRPERPMTIAKSAPPLPLPRSANGNGHGPRSVERLLADAADGGRLSFE
jgi:cyclic dehypoxanthinyl futalosine synthase